MRLEQRYFRRNLKGFMLRNQLFVFYFIFNLMVFNTYREKPFIFLNQVNKDTKVQAQTDNGSFFYLDDLSECDDDISYDVTPIYFELQETTSKQYSVCTNHFVKASKQIHKLFLLYCSLKLDC